MAMSQKEINELIRQKNLETDNIENNTVIQDISDIISMLTKYKNRPKTLVEMLALVFAKTVKYKHKPESIVSRINKYLRLNLSNSTNAVIKEARQATLIKNEELLYGKGRGNLVKRLGDTSYKVTVPTKEWLEHKQRLAVQEEKQEKAKADLTSGQAQINKKKEKDLDYGKR